MNDISRFSNTSGSTESLKKEPVNIPQNAPIRYAKKHPSKFKSEELKVIEQFYFNLNRTHPDYIEN